MKKKPLYNDTVNILEESKETLQQRVEEKKYNSGYLEELKSLHNLSILLTNSLEANERLNESAKDRIQNIQMLHSLGHDDDEAIEMEESQAMEIEEDDEMDEDQRRAIEQAKDLRERKRKMNTGDYLSLNQAENEDKEIIGDTNKKEILKEIFKEKKDKENKNQGNVIEEESDEEFQALESRILKQNLTASKVSS